MQSAKQRQRIFKVLPDGKHSGGCRNRPDFDQLGLNALQQAHKA
ncbi:hypothetical protein [Desulfonatronovibrio magnus]|nr:hypothetical protein [Desulfonatronovibrio magnus]